MRKTTEKHRDAMLWTITTPLEDLVFADDISLFSHSQQGCIPRKRGLPKSQRRRGLGSAIRAMRVNTRNSDNIELDGEADDEVEELSYLGSNISKDGRSDRDIQVRTGKARTAVK